MSRAGGARRASGTRRTGGTRRVSGTRRACGPSHKGRARSGLVDKRRVSLCFACEKCCRCGGVWGSCVFASGVVWERECALFSFVEGRLSGCVDVCECWGLAVEWEGEVVGESVSASG